MDKQVHNRKFHLLDGRKRKSSSPSVGKKVKVYLDPISRERPEGIATIASVIDETGWNDAAGNPVFRCNVRFAGGLVACERDVSFPENIPITN
jgi:hypothetical protein